MENPTVPYLRRVRWTQMLTHLLVLLIIFVAPEMLFSVGHKVPRLLYVGPVCYILLFYLNYYYLIEKYLFSHNRKWVFYVVNVVIALLFMIAIYYIRSISFPEMGGMHHRPPFGGGPRMGPPPPPDGPLSFLGHRPWMKIFKITPQVLPILMSIGLSVVLKFGEKWVKWDRMEQQMDVERQENELKNLKNQLNPHFLFNTLNNIYALIPISQQKAQLAVHDLSQLLRYMLYDNTNVREVALEKDLLFIKNYIALMRLRLNSSVKLTVRINEQEGTGKSIAPLLFISLVENAFKHGVSAEHPSYIDICIMVKDNTVICRVENSCYPKDEKDKSGSGIGINNLRRQLSILYPDRHRFEIMNENNKYISELEINLTPQNKTL